MKHFIRLVLPLVATSFLPSGCSRGAADPGPPKSLQLSQGSIVIDGYQWLKEFKVVGGSDDDVVGKVIRPPEDQFKIIAVQCRFSTKDGANRFEKVGDSLKMESNGTTCACLGVWFLVDKQSGLHHFWGPVGNIAEGGLKGHAEFLFSVPARAKLEDLRLKSAAGRDVPVKVLQEIDIEPIKMSELHGQVEKQKPEPENRRGGSSAAEGKVAMAPVSREAREAYERGLKLKGTEAIEAFTEAIRADNKYAEAYCARGRARLFRGREDEAIADYTEAIRLTPRWAEAYVGRGDVYHVGKDDDDKALADYTEAIRCDPTYARAYNARGMLYSGRRDVDKAIDDFTRAIELLPNDWMAYQNRAVTYLMKGDKTAAEADSDKAEKLKAKKATERPDKMRTQTSQ